MNETRSNRIDTGTATSRASLIRVWALRSPVVIVLLLELILYAVQTPPLVVAAAAVGVASLLLARRWPYVPLIINLGVSMLGGPTPLALVVAYFVIMSSRRPGWRMILPTALALLGAVRPWSIPVGESLAFSFFVGGVTTTLAAVFGLLVFFRRELASTLEELRVSQERERLASADAAAVGERARIAREMHDMVSHQVSLIAVEAGAVQATTRDASTKKTARAIRELSVQTLTELRYLLGVLRAPR